MSNQMNLPAVIKDAAGALKLNLSEYNVLLPTQTFGQVLGEYDKVTLEVVSIDPDPHGGEVSDIGGKLALGRVPLEKIGSAVGIIWQPELTTIIESTETKSRAKATGALRKANGEWIVMSEEKTVDLLAFEEEQRLSIEEKAEKGNFEGEVAEWGKTKNGRSYPIAFHPWKSEAEKAAVCDRALRKAMLQFRKFKDERAMTGAKERCIRALLALKSSYAADELSKPFVFPRVVLDSAKMLASPEMRAAAVERMTGAIGSIFGRKREESTGDVQGIAEVIHAPDEEEPVAATGPEPDADDGFEEVPPQAETPPFAKDDPRKALREKLAAILEDKAKRDVLSRRKDKSNGKIALDMVSEVVSNQEATADELEAMIKRCDKLFGAVAPAGGQG